MREGALVQWLWVTTYVQKVVGLNTGAVYWMNIWTFFTLICYKNCIACLKRPKISKKEAGLAHFRIRKNIQIQSSYCPSLSLEISRSKVGTCKIGTLLCGIDGSLSTGSIVSNSSSSSSKSSTAYTVLNIRLYTILLIKRTSLLNVHIPR